MRGKRQRAWPQPQTTAGMQQAQSRGQERAGSSAPLLPKAACGVIPEDKTSYRTHAAPSRTVPRLGLAPHGATGTALPGGNPADLSRRRRAETAQPSPTGPAAGAARGGPGCCAAVSCLGAFSRSVAREKARCHLDAELSQLPSTPGRRAPRHDRLRVSSTSPSQAKLAAAGSCPKPAAGEGTGGLEARLAAHMCPTMGTTHVKPEHPGGARGT